MRAFRLAYDGRPYRGFQRQPDVPTVEDALFDALRSLGVLAPDEAKPAGYAAAGRTDAGVSAVAQTIAFDTPGWLAPRALNAELPASIRAWAHADVPDDFHARHDATRRTYRYHLHAPDASLSRAREAAAALSGEHDFYNLTTDRSGTVRELDCRVERDGAFLRLRVAAGGYPRGLVRRLATVVGAVATGACERDRIDRLLSPSRVDGGEGVAPAPPEPLVLRAVEYPGVAFESDPEAAASARQVFERERVDGLVRARVAADLADGV